MIAYIGATFDLPHFGHQRLIAQAKSMADTVVCVLNTDDFVQRFKHKTPILTLEERMETIKGFKGVDIVDVNIGGEDSKPMLLKYKPDYIIFGDDYDIERYKKQIGVDDTFLIEHNMKHVQLHYTKSNSTANIIQRCRL
jgi:glycerol-3-phosphate cytidylyltransferase